MCRILRPFFCSDCRQCVHVSIGRARFAAVRLLELTEKRFTEVSGAVFVHFGEHVIAVHLILDPVSVSVST